MGADETAMAFNLLVKPFDVTPDRATDKEQMCVAVLLPRALGKLLPLYPLPSCVYCPVLKSLGLPRKRSELWPVTSNPSRVTVQHLRTHIGLGGQRDARNAGCTPNTKKRVLVNEVTSISANDWSLEAKSTQPPRGSQNENGRRC